MLLAPGCSDGQLAQSAVDAPCPAGDLDCEAAPTTAPIAAGALLALEIRPVIVGGVSAAVSLRSGDDAVLVVEDGLVRAVAPGVAAVLAVGDDGAVVDLTHLSVIKADRLTLHRGGGAERDERALPTAIQVFPNEELSLSLRTWSGAQELAGDVLDRWTVSDPAFLLVDQGFPAERRLRVPAAGTATLTIDAVGLQQTLSLEVVQ
ncbi:MAG: hypothetical protein A2138_11885 [Deltaproteobacteria bacterium RBG_16_71_12]|nr:MAG: hypothetical protein A2138_11885 [Deltaproteobacteria bacterium RBG_16_71_12]